MVFLCHESKINFEIYITDVVPSSSNTVQSPSVPVSRKYHPGKVFLSRVRYYIIYFVFFSHKLQFIRTDPPSPLRASLLTSRAMSRGSSCQCCLSGALDGELIGNASLTHVARSRPAGVWDYHSLWDRHF